MRHITINYWNTCVVTPVSPSFSSAFRPTPAEMIPSDKLETKLDTLRALGVVGDRVQLVHLLKTSSYNVEVAVNRFYESGLPAATAGQKPRTGPLSVPKVCVREGGDAWESWVPAHGRACQCLGVL